MSNVGGIRNMPSKKPEVSTSESLESPPKGFVRVSEFPPLVTFDTETDVGKSIQGTVKKIKTVKTPKSKTGEMKIAEMVDDEGKTFAIALSAALLNILPDCVGKYVLVKYIGEQYNENTKQNFKKFDVLQREE
jgi:hypothetical protein